MKFPHLLEQVEQVLSFVYKHLFRANEEVSLIFLPLPLTLQQIIARIATIFHQSALSHTTSSQQTPLSGKMLPLILRDTLLSLIPKVDAEVEMFQASISQTCLEFEKNMTLLGFFHEITPEGSGSKSVSNLLSKTVQEIPTKFLEARSSLPFCLPSVSSPRPAPLSPL
jgi:hypothetical protein